jgi:TPR repeat protein
MAQSSLSQSFSTICRPRSGLKLRAALLALFTFTLAALALEVNAQQSRGLEPILQPSDLGVPVGSYYALVIGINNYSTPLAKLKTAVNDAKSVGSMLHDRYGFQVTYLLDQNATRFKILEALSAYRNTLGANDNLLIYYAGHGYSDHDAEKAYWLPVDADSATSPNRIIADDLTTGVRVLPSRHVLIISDSCYSGALTRDADSPVRSDGQAAFIARMLRSRSRTLMASGGDEPVSDAGSEGHSVFAYAVLHALSAENQPVFTASDLFYGSVRQQVAGRSEQMPQYSIIRNSDHDEGDFVFTRLAAHPPVAIATASLAPLPAATRAPAATPTAPAAIPTESKITPVEANARGEAFARERRYADAAPLLTDACNSGIAGSCTDLGWFYENGFGVNRSDAQAVALYRKACDGGNMRGCNDLGLMHENGRGVGKDEDEAVELYRKGCDGADALACKNLGNMFANGKGVGKDDKQAIDLYRKSRDTGLAAGCTELAVGYFNGKGVSKDYNLAFAAYHKACDGGDAGGCNSLGGMYINGQGVTKDEAQGAALLLKSCDAGFPIACNNIGWMYQNGRGVPEGDAKALPYFQRACDGGYASGCTNLGSAYLDGKGVEKAPGMAVFFYGRGCASGDPMACSNQSVLYLNGTGADRDEAKAAGLARKACDGGYLRGCSNLGWLYQNGRGVNKDLNQAEELYHRACEGGVQEGCTNLKNLKSPPQLEPQSQPKPPAPTLGPHS